MFAIETTKRRFFRGEILCLNGSFAQTSEDIEKTLDQQGYIVVVSTNPEHDNARIPAEKIKSYAKFREDHLYKLNELPF